ncbi:MAG: MtrB/PioB family decaheme-associated outer membrane protein [Candidatus Aminicenantales bacterium]
MKQRIFAIALTGLMIGLGTLPVGAQDKKKDDPIVVKGSVAAGVQAVGETARSSKFTEYRDVPRGLFVPFLTLDLRKGSRFVRIDATNLGQSDQRLRAELGDRGTFRLDVGYDQIPHRFSFFAATPYVEHSAGVFTLNDVIRSAAEALVPTGTGTNIAAARALVSSFLTSAGPIALGLERHTATADLTYTPSVPFSFNATASHETRSGNRAFGASLGFSNAIELPEPIHYQTTNLDTSLEYHQKQVTLRGGVAASFFDNDVQTLVWDNPYRITDSTYASAYSAGNGTAHGRMALPPSNDAVRFYLSGTYKPLPGTRLSAAASYGAFNQNEKLLPFTINTAIPGSDPNALDAISAPRETAMAKAHVSSLDLTLSSRLMRSVYLTAGFRYYDFANRIEALEIPTGYARLDQVWENVPIAIEPYSYSRSRLFGDLSVNLLKDTTLKVGYSVYNVRRHEGTAEAEKNKSDEGSFKVSVDSHPSDWLMLRVSYLDSRRRWSLDDTFVAYAPSFNFKRYFEASRDRQAVNALVGLSPIDRLDIELTYALGRDDYLKSAYGLTSDNFDMYGLDVSYAFSKKQMLYAFYTRELYDSRQGDRQSGATFSTNPQDDWTANMKDAVDTFGAGQSIEIIAKKLDFDLSGSYSRAHGTSFLDSPPGGAPDLAINFIAPLDTTVWWTIQSSFKWKVTEKLFVVFGYWYEEYGLKDIVRNDIAVDYASAGAVFLGALEPGYRYHVGSVRFVYGW